MSASISAVDPPTPAAAAAAARAFISHTRLVQLLTTAHQRCDREHTRIYHLEKSEGGGGTHLTESSAAPATTQPFYVSGWSTKEELTEARQILFEEDWLELELKSSDRPRPGEIYKLTRYILISDELPWLKLLSELIESHSDSASIRRVYPNGLNTDLYCGFQTGEPEHNFLQYAATQGAVNCCKWLIQEKQVKDKEQVGESSAATGEIRAMLHNWNLECGAFYSNSEDEMEEVNTMGQCAIQTEATHKINTHS